MFFKKRETPEEKAARLDRLHAEMEQLCHQGQDKYDQLVAEAQQVLRSASKPAECSTIRFANAPYLFPKLKSFQYYDTDWEIWKSNDTLYLYCAEVEDYPEGYCGKGAPLIAAIPTVAIQQFRVDGAMYSETKISGGKVTQSRYTGKVRQTALQSKTILHDTRSVKMSVLVNGAVKLLELEYAAFDVLCALIPEKERK